MPLHDDDHLHPVRGPKFAEDLKTLGGSLDTVWAKAAIEELAAGTAAQRGHRRILTFTTCIHILFTSRDHDLRHPHYCQVCHPGRFERDCPDPAAFTVPDYSTLISD